MVKGMFGLLDGKLGIGSGSKICNADVGTGLRVSLYYLCPYLYRLL